MPFDGMLLNRVVRDLKKYEGAKIGKIQCLSDEEVLFYLHKPGMGSTRLALSAHSNTYSICVQIRKSRFPIQVRLS